MLLLPDAGGKFPPTSEEAHFQAWRALAAACFVVLLRISAGVFLPNKKSEFEVHEKWLFSIGIICLFMNLILLGCIEKLFYCLF